MAVAQNRYYYLLFAFNSKTFLVKKKEFAGGRPGQWSPGVPRVRKAGQKMSVGLSNP